MNILPSTVKKFRKHIFLWWENHQRDLPWRHTSDPYRILVSEIMLQQTQVSRVIVKYTEFLETFPDVSVLAGASPADVIRLWKGLGYNRRALYLHKTAKMICDTYNGSFPMNHDLLTKLPGLGTYTARALLVFAYKKNIALIDTNIRNIITHYFYTDIPQTESEIQRTADQLLPKGKAWEWNQALMDHGALAMPAFKKPIVIKRKAIPFRASSRFYRGRIMDALRIKAIPETELVRDMYITHGSPEEYIGDLIEGLIHDGLAIRKKGSIRLPE